MIGFFSTTLCQEETIFVIIGPGGIQEEPNRPAIRGGCTCAGKRIILLEDLWMSFKSQTGVAFCCARRCIFRAWGGSAPTASQGFHKEHGSGHAAAEGVEGGYFAVQGRS